MQEEQTPLHIASRLGKTEIVQLLLQHMAHPDAATTNGYTPLHISAREGQVDVASVLLEAGAAHSLATKVRVAAAAGTHQLPFSARDAAQRVGLSQACAFPLFASGEPFPGRSEGAGRVVSSLR